jgi:hypothetical protein
MLVNTSTTYNDPLFILSIERPLREWELVFDIVSTWEPDGNNALLVKKYSYHYTLTSEVMNKL